MFGTKDNGYSTSLDMLTGGLGNVMTIDQPSFEWGVMIDEDRAVTIRDFKALDAAHPGIGNTPITLWLNKSF
mgnify:FL=1